MSFTIRYPTTPETEPFSWPAFETLEQAQRKKEADDARGKRRRRRKGGTMR